MVSVALTTSHLQLVEAIYIPGSRGERITLRNLPIMLYCTAPKMHSTDVPIMLNRCPYYAQQMSLLCSTDVPIMLNRCPYYAQQMSLLCSTDVPIMLNRCPYYAQQMSLLCSTDVPIMFIKLSRVCYYRHLTLNFN